LEVGRLFSALTIIHFYTYLKAVDLLTINEENRLRVQMEELTIAKSQMDEFRSEPDPLKANLGLDPALGDYK
jgi:hypothetical protein